jgi:hypothetical protein
MTMRVYVASSWRNIRQPEVVGAIRDAEATVLLLPCGRSSHLELGYACGAGQRTLVLLDNPMSEPELMYLMTTKICVTLVEVLEGLRP